MDIQRVELIGRTTSLPELKTSKGNTEYSSIRMAVNTKRKKTDGSEERRATFYKILLFGKRVNIYKDLEKGRKIRVVGNFTPEAYLSKTGEPRTDLTILADDFQVFDTDMFKK